MGRACGPSPSTELGAGKLGPYFTEILVGAGFSRPYLPVPRSYLIDTPALTTIRVVGGTSGHCSDHS